MLLTLIAKTCVNVLLLDSFITLPYSIAFLKQLFNKVKCHLSLRQSQSTHRRSILIVKYLQIRRCNLVQD